MRQLIIALPCALLFFLLTLFAGVFEESLLFQSVAVIASSVLLMPLYFDKIPRKWSFARKLRTHFLFATTVLFLLNAGYFYRAGVMKDKAYDYQFGHLSGPFRTVYATLPFQFAIDQIYHLLPLNDRVAMYQFEDMARIRRIQQEVNDDFIRSLLCYEKDRATCFMKIVRATAKEHPPGTAGTMALYEEGTDLLKSGEKKNIIELEMIVKSLSERPDTVIQYYVPGFPEKEVSADMTLLMKKEKKIRDLLSRISA